MKVLNYRLENFQALVVVAIVFLTAATFVVDLMVPLGLVDWLPYVVVVLLCMWVPNRHCDLIVAGICTVLMAVGFLYSAPYLSPSVDLINRSIGVLVIWLVAILCLRRKRAGEGLREREAHFRAVAESAPNAFVGTDSGGRIISWNEAAQQMFQYTAEEILSQPLTMIMPERYREACRKGMERYQGTGVRHVIGKVVELHGLRKDGGEFPVEISLSSWETNRGEVYHGIIRDITERKRLEQELALREGSLNSFFTSAPAGLAIVNTELRFLQVNDTLAQMHGLAAQEHLGKTVGEVLPKLAPVIEPIFRQLLATGEPALNFETSGETPAQPGVLRHWVASYFPIQGADGSPNSVGAIVVEITDRKQVEEQLRSSSEQLRALAAHLQSVREEEGIRIAREIHDELSPTLTTLMMDLSQLANGLTTDQKPLVGKIEIMSKLVETTIQSMRKIAGELRPGVLDDLGLVAAIDWQAQEFHTRTGIRCEAILPGEDIALDSARSTAIFRISQEILTNVARHSRASRVNITLREDAGNVILEAQDNGKGITEGEISSSMSLGLLGMRERALQFGGELKISGIPGKGTTVTVRIPLKQI